MYSIVYKLGESMTRERVCEIENPWTAQRTALIQLLPAYIIYIYLFKIVQGEQIAWLQQKLLY